MIVPLTTKQKLFSLQLQTHLSGSSLDAKFKIFKLSHQIKCVRHMYEILNLDEIKKLIT